MSSTRQQQSDDRETFRTFRTEEVDGEGREVLGHEVIVNFSPDDDAFSDCGVVLITCNTGYSFLVTCGLFFTDNRVECSLFGNSDKLPRIRERDGEAFSSIYQVAINTLPRAKDRPLGIQVKGSSAIYQQTYNAFDKYRRKGTVPALAHFLIHKPGEMDFTELMYTGKVEPNMLYSCLLRSEKDFDEILPAELQSALKQAALGTGIIKDLVQDDVNKIKAVWFEVDDENHDSTSKQRPIPFVVYKIII